MTQGHEKLLYAVACVAAIILAVSSLGLVAVQGRNDARIGLRTTAAVCALRAFYQGQVDQSEAFLRLSPAERTAKYGSIGDVPTPEIRVGLAHERQVLVALRPLRCS